MDNDDMAIKKKILIPVIIVLFLLPQCGSDREPKPMIDMESIESDGSHNQRYIFRKELEKEERRNNRYKSEKSKF